MYQAILFLPLVGALFAGTLGRLPARAPAEVVTTTLVLITALLSWLAFYQVAILRPGGAHPARAVHHLRRS